MINVTYDKKRMALEVEGHAEYADKGHDIVCAAVSVLFYTAAEKLFEIFGEKYVEVGVSEAGFAEIKASKLKNSQRCKDIFEFVLCGIKMIEKDYGEFVKLTIK